MNIQEKIDGVYPGLLTAAFITLCWWLMSKKKISPNKVMLLLVVVALIGVALVSLTHILNTKVKTNLLVGVFENEVNGPPLLALHSQFYQEESHGYKTRTCQWI